MRKFKLLIAFAIVCTVCGCSSSYERDTSSGKVETILLGEASLKKDKKETFVLLLSQTRCGSCIDFKGVLKSYLKKHNITFYEVALDKEQATQTENLMIIEHNLTNFSTTPSLFYIKNGEQVSDLQPLQDGITEEMLEKWVVDNKIDEKK